MSPDWYKSKTYIGLVVLLLPALLKMIGVELSDVEVQAWSENILEFIGIVLVIIGRARAKGPINFRKPIGS